MFVTVLAKKLYKILHTLSVVFFRNAGDTPNNTCISAVPPFESLDNNRYHSMKKGSRLIQYNFTLNSYLINK
ncbi:hypothetical protein COD09_18395 [Bacillus cereus]|uniref:Uncharacterized protein n=1 Tax=Bacillus cereus TaxID=1396 RepID=A0A2C1DHV4_BACCE|nr:hypothetical protein COD09_18395 [Bacillus cereus]